MPEESTIDQLGFLLGRWVGDRFGETVEEVWTRVSATSMMGMFCWMSEEGPHLLELLLIQQRPTGITLALRAFAAQDDLPERQSGRSVLWRLVHHDESEATFEALEPGARSRISYRRERLDRLYATLVRVEDDRLRIYPYHFKAASLIDATAHQK